MHTGMFFTSLSFSEELLVLWAQKYQCHIKAPTTLCKRLALGRASSDRNHAKQVNGVWAALEQANLSVELSNPAWKLKDEDV